MNEKNRIMIYGANGYSAKLILEELLNRNIKPILAGRNEIQIKNIAENTGCEFKIFDLSDKEIIIDNLKDIRVLLNCAGPFYQTARVLIDACLESGTSYLDITGEIEVFEYAWKNSCNAEEKGIVIMPGVGFDVIPTDCLAKKLKEEMPDAITLKLGFASSKSKASRGTFKSVVTHLDKNILVRQNGKMIPVELGSKVEVIDFGDFKATALAIQWADVYNAYYSTGIPNIEAYIAVPGFLIKLLRMFIGVLTSNIVKSALIKFADTFITGPDENARKKSFSYIWGAAANEKGNKIEHVYLFPDGYTLTALGASESVIRIFNGESKPGTQTPSLAFGSSFMDMFIIKPIERPSISSQREDFQK